METSLIEQNKINTSASDELAKNLLGMKELLQEKSGFLNLPNLGDILSGKVIEKGRNRIFLDLGIFKTGVIYKNEIDAAEYNFADIKKGDILTVKIIDLENKEGLMELSLNEAGLEKSWEEVKALQASGQTLEVKITGANRGGLTAQINNLAAFLPVSQLSNANYPHVDGGDKDEILKRLKKFVGTGLTVKVLDCDQKLAKIILSEKAKTAKEVEAKLSAYKVGEIVNGEITGLVDFGAFMIFDGVEGLVHISELAWQLVEKPSDIVKVGEKIQAKIIALEDERVSLSLKALQPNPWDDIENKYKKGDMVTGTVIKFNPFGAFVKIGSEIQALAHISEFKTFQEMTAALALNQNYPFKIIALEPKEYKMALQLVARIHDTSSIPDQSEVIG